MEIIFFEKVLIKLLFTNTEVSEKTIPFLIPEIFEDHKNIQLIKTIISLMEKYEHFPSVPEMKIELDNEEVYNRLIEIMNLDISEYRTEFLNGQIEEFIRNKLVHNVNVDIAMSLNNENDELLKQSPDKLREAIAFSFDTKVGLDFLDEEERLYNHLHNKDRVIPTSITQLNRLIEGGFHCKSLTLFMAECVDENTMVNIRYKRNGKVIIKKIKNWLSVNVRSFYMEKWIEKTLSLKEVKNLLKENVVEVTSPDGWVPVTKYIEKGNKVAWNLEVDDISVLSSAKHLYETNNGWKFTKDLDCEIDLILTENGLKNFKISKTNKKIKVVDISVNHKNHRYYTNGISSHNTNLGKSLIMTSLAVDCILKNKNVLYISCEMSEEKISERIMANMFDIATEDLKLLPRNKFHEKFEKINSQVNKKIVIKEYPPRAINTNNIRNLIKELKVRKKFIPDIIFIDYLGIMNPIFRNKGDNTYLEVKRISEEVRALAVELGLPIISAVQTNRGGFGDSEIDLTDISDSIGTAATADIIIGVTQSEDYRKIGKFNWIMLKNRYGLNKHVFPVNVDYYKMRVYEDDDAKITGTASSITKNIPPSEKEKEKSINDTIKDVKDVLNNDLKQKMDKMLGKFQNIE